MVNSPVRSTSIKGTPSCSAKYRALPLSFISIGVAVITTHSFATLNLSPNIFITAASPVSMLPEGGFVQIDWIQSGPPEQVRDAHVANELSDLRWRARPTTEWPRLEAGAIPADQRLRLEDFQ